jgi:hypothetical protein
MCQVIVILTLASQSSSMIKRPTISVLDTSKPHCVSQTMDRQWLLLQFRRAQKAEK